MNTVSLPVLSCGATTSSVCLAVLSWLVWLSPLGFSHQYTPPRPFVRPTRHCCPWTSYLITLTVHLPPPSPIQSPLCPSSPQLNVSPTCSSILNPPRQCSLFNLHTCIIVLRGFWGLECVQSVTELAQLFVLFLMKTNVPQRSEQTKWMS